MIDLIVVMAYCRKDYALALDNLVFMRDLHGVFPGRIVLHHDSSLGDSVLWTVTKFARLAFREVIHSRYPAPAQGRWPQAPNHSFQHAAMFMLNQSCKGWLWFEPDCVPVSAQWLIVLNHAYQQSNKLFLGTSVAGCGHFNGVAIYPQDAARRIPSAMRATDKPFDTCMADEVRPNIHVSPLIQHCGAVQNHRCIAAGWPLPDFRSQEDAQMINEKCVLFHPVKNNSLRAMLRSGMPFNRL